MIEKFKPIYSREAGSYSFDGLKRSKSETGWEKAAARGVIALAHVFNVKMKDIPKKRQTNYAHIY